MAETAVEPPIHVFHHAFRRGGGKERYAIALVSAFRQLGHKVTFHALGGDRELAQSLGVELDLVKAPRFPRKLESLFFFRAVDRLRPRCSGIQISLSRVRVNDILVSGGTHLGYLERARKWQGPFDLLQIRLEKAVYRSVNRIVAPADLIATDLENKYAVPASKLSILYAPVDERFQGGEGKRSRLELRQQFRWPDDKVVFLFPSRGHGRKGLDPICEALGYFSDHVILAVAGKPASMRKWSFVKSMGYLEDMAAAYRAADYTILGSFYEPFRLVGPESIMCGTRLVFEEGIGCLAAIRDEFVHKFSVWDSA